MINKIDKAKSSPEKDRNSKINHWKKRFQRNVEVFSVRFNFQCRINAVYIL